MFHFFLYSEKKSFSQDFIKGNPKKTSRKEADGDVPVKRQYKEEIGFHFFCMEGKCTRARFEVLSGKFPLMNSVVRQQNWT